MLETKAVRRSMKDFREVVAMFDDAFPKNERVPIWYLRLVALKKSVDFKAYYDGDDLVGFSYVSSHGKASFLFYLAVNRKIRSKGYGSRILQMIRKENEGRDIYLNIEPVEENAENLEQRRERLGFYERNGFHEADYTVEYRGDIFTVLTTSAEPDGDEYLAAIQNVALEPFRLSRRGNEGDQ